MAQITDNWIPVIGSVVEFDVLTKTLPSKGNLVYEYNPLRNYRLSKNMYEYKNNLFSLEQLYSIYSIRIEYSYNGQKYYSIDEIVSENPYINNSTLNTIKKTGVWVGLPDQEEPLLREPGELVDFITDELTFSLTNPVNIVPQYSYDGSVNLVINDGLNIPRMINSRFSATGKNTYEIIDRKGNNDTNIYDQGTQFDIDSSLYKRIVNIPKIEFTGINVGGNLKVGNYHFYFKLADADGNETDFVGESGLVSVFIGTGLPSSVHTGTKNENSFKTVTFQLSNIDSAYDNVTVYYSRNTVELNENFVTEYVKISKNFKVNNSGFCNIVITGFENTENISATDINLNYNVVDSAYTQAVCQNMLFMANVHKPDIPYKELSDLSLRFLPYVKETTYDLAITEDYSLQSSTLGYYDPKYIYNNVGYWNKEIYRFGIVYILPNNELSPVFNIRGANGIREYSDDLYTNIPVFNGSERIYINYNEEDYSILKTENIQLSTNITYENVKGVVRLDSDSDYNTIYGIDIRVSDEVIQELRKHVKGYFFVRQRRIPTILAQGLTIGVDSISHTPTIPTKGGLIDSIRDSGLDKTHVEISNINDVNYISEGFLSRYRFKLKAKNSFLKILSTVVSYAATAVSFVPGIGTGVALALNAANFITSTIASGKFQLASFVSTAVSSLPALGAAMSKAAQAAKGIKSLEDINKVQKIISQVDKAGNTLKGIQTVVKANETVTTATKIIQLSNVLQSTYNTITTGLQLASSGISYNGRHSEVPSGYEKKETSDSRLLQDDFINKFIITDPKVNKVQAIICPDFEVNQPYYNQIFTGGEHLIRYTKVQGINYYNYLQHLSSSNYLSNNSDRHFYFNSYFDTDTDIAYTSKIIGVPDNVKCVGIDNEIFRSRAGEAEEAWRYEFVGKKYDDTTDIVENSDIIRGAFGPYLACSTNKLDPAMIVDIMIPGYSDANINKYFQIRMDDSSVFNAISERIDIHKDQDDYLVNKSKGIGIDNKSFGYSYNLYRGDCYICQYTHRLNRNFNDPSAPYNDEIVDDKTWKDNYDPDNTENYNLINLGDVNAVPMGTWITFKLRSSNNLNIRTLDGSNVDESAMVGHPRGFFPYNPMTTEGTFKHPDSQIYNKGFSVSLSERWNFELPDVPHIKNWFGTRIMYSDIHVNDAYKNGFRVFQGTHYRDYTRDYGEIVKLVPFESSLLCVFEHGIALIPVNERAIAGQGSGGNVYINTSNVLPENPKIISDVFGSQWSESILKVPGRTGDAPQYVYGVDTVAKKIWRTDGNSFECISDFKVQEFLNNNITLGERELTPKIGIRNVKTHYNAFKRDVMFTFYDNTYGFEEKVWNLCWNELLQKFITFYSWVPSYMENINNVPFSFDRNTSKWIAKLGTSHANSSFADGITLTNVVIDDTFRENGSATSNTNIPVTYIAKDGSQKTLTVDGSRLNKFIAGLSLSNRVLPDSQVHYKVDFELLKDSQENYKLFRILKVKDVVLPEDAMFAGAKVPVYALCFNDGDDEWQEVYYKDGDNYENVIDNLGNYIYSYKALYKPEALYSELYYRNSAGNAYADYDVHKLGTENITTDNIPQEWIENEQVLEELLTKLPPETIVGNCSTVYNRNNPPQSVYPCTTLGEIINEITYDAKGNPKVHGIYLSQHWTVGSTSTDSDRKVWYDLPIFKDITGKRPMLPKEEQVNPDKLVTLLNIRANISIVDVDNSKVSLSDTYYNMKASYEYGTTLINAGQYESVVAITPKWNLQFLSTDFWKHGQAGIIDIADDIYPTYWYGKQHPFEFEVVVVNNPSTHKIFQNLELVANKAKPESFHYEIIGECYDFAKDKVNMYFRQEAMKALWQYNGADICYDRNFLKVQPKQQAKSADFPHKYYTRQDTINDIEDYYINITYPSGYDYRHLSGAEIVYYPNRQEYRIWNHAKAVNIDDLSQDDPRSIIAANCQYLEDRWKVTINPILVCYRNEYTKKFAGPLIQPINTTWTKSVGGEYLPNLPIYNSPIPDKILSQGEIKFPDTSTGDGKDNALYGLYDNLYNAIDTVNWLNTSSTSGYNAVRHYYNEYGEYVSSTGYNFGEAQNRKELDIKDKFVKVRIRYSGEELAVIDFLNTVYRISYA